MGREEKKCPAALETGRIKPSIEYYLVRERICQAIAVFMMRNSRMHFIFPRSTCSRLE